MSLVRKEAGKESHASKLRIKKTAFLYVCVCLCIYLITEFTCLLRAAVMRREDSEKMMSVCLLFHHFNVCQTQHVRTRTPYWLCFFSNNTHTHKHLFEVKLNWPKTRQARRQELDFPGTPRKQTGVINKCSQRYAHHGLFSVRSQGRRCTPRNRWCFTT